MSLANLETSEDACPERHFAGSGFSSISSTQFDPMPSITTSTATPAAASSRTTTTASPLAASPTSSGREIKYSESSSSDAGSSRRSSTGQVSESCVSLQRSKIPKNPNFLLNWKNETGHIWSSHQFTVNLCSVWPDWATFCTLGNHLKPVATINLPKSPHSLSQFL